MQGKKFLIRTLCVLLALLFICVYFFYLLYDAQVVNAITDTASTDVNLYSVTETVEAARGNITDRYGRVLVTNRTVYQVELDIDSMGDEARQGEVVSRLIEICKEQGLSWTNKEFPVAYDAQAGAYAFTTDNPYITVSNGKYTQTRLDLLCQQMEWTVNGGVNGMSADELVKQMCATFGLTSQSPEDTLEILGVLYSALLRAGTDQLIWTDYYFLEDVEFSFISRVKEEGLDGVNIVATTERVYNTDYAGVLLGQVGAISAESWAANKEQYVANGYSMDSTIGLSGAESAFEQSLRGVNGEKKVTMDLSGNVVAEEYTTEPVAGNNVTLTLDIGLQQVCEEALAKYTDSLNNGIAGSAAVVMNLKGEVLAAASYPTYSAADYLENYKDLATNERSPLLNRAFSGTYAPGSTYKICSATAGLTSGNITTSSTFVCNYVFQYYDSEMHCWYKRGHGTETVRDAIRDSCNVFFYNVADLIGISTLTEYAQAYGLGVSSGIELSESTGVNAGPEFSASIGSTWTAGMTLSTAIGQSDNQFTPLQLANYIATFINGGDRYSAHLKKSVKSNDNSAIIEVTEPTILNHVELSQAGYNAIKTGMGEVIAADGLEGDFEKLTALGIDVGCKTGTAEVGVKGGKTYNALFVSFAPYDDPEIVICTVVEKTANSGADTAPITAEIMEYYFSSDAELERVSLENTLLH